MEVCSKNGCKKAFFALGWFIKVLIICLLRKLNFCSSYLSNSMSAHRGCDFGVDRISGLPDDIILTFLSLMGMKEATKTSILSKRWRYLWAERTHLDFDYSLIIPQSIRPLTAAQKGRYINWVNQVVDLHCNPCIDTFRVIFPFHGSEAAHHFDKWVKFALLRKVKNLELKSPSRGPVYTLGFDSLKLSVGIGDNGITSLRSLHLCQVDVSGDFIEFLLSKCHHLERLYVSRSEILVRLNVIGLSCKLKQLAIQCCRNLEKLEIDDVNLTHLDYIGWNISTNIVLKNMPMLAEAAFGGTMFRSPVSIFQQISHLAANIYKLSLDMMNNEFPGGAIPTFCNLKHLNMVVGHPQLSAAYITPLLEACPVLHGLKVEADSPFLSREARFLKIMDQSNESDFEVYLDYFELEQTKRKPRLNLGLSNGIDLFKAYLDFLESGQTERKTHPNLKLLEVTGYRGYSPEVDVIVSIMLSACNLETIIFDPFSCIFPEEAHILEISRARALKLGKIIPSKIRLVFK